MIPYRTWGEAPYTVALVHGGPGAPGEMGPVARELATGVLEPFQAAASVPGQVDELAGQLLEHASLPVVLVGHSWGAMLALLVAAARPRLVRRLVLIGSGPLDPAFVDGIMPARLGRLGPEDRAELLRLQERVRDPSRAPPPEDLARFGFLVDRADSVDPIAPGAPEFAPQPGVHRRVWGGAEALRASGYFVERARSVACPVTVIHGDTDPRPLEGVVAPLRAVGRAPRVHLLRDCGHTPWLERGARDEFFAVLRRQLGEPGDVLSV